jgi:hypothetical protein
MAESIEVKSPRINYKVMMPWNEGYLPDHVIVSMRSVDGERISISRILVEWWNCRRRRAWLFRDMRRSLWLTKLTPKPDYSAGYFEDEA